MTSFISRVARAAALPVLLEALAACTANIEGDAGRRLPAGGSSASSAKDGSGVASDATDPGRVTMHRLNLAEYDNTMRDLLGTHRRPSVDFGFPADDRGADFDNASDALTVSPRHVQSYNHAVPSLLTEAMGVPAQRALLVSCDLATLGPACARASLEAFVPRAWRREVTASEIDGLMTVVAAATEQGESVEQGFEQALRAVLLSPYFIYRPELDPEPSSPAPHPLSDYELASRLSYFLWSSMPDAELFDVAKSHKLHDSGQLANEVTRMLADPKAQALIDNFAGQWLFIRLFDEIDPTPTLFPGFDDSLRSAFKSESTLLFREFAFNGLPADQLLTANFTFANDRLAKFYGLPPVGSTTPQRVDLTSHPERRGFLAHGGVLAANAHPDLSSPVRRGKYVLTQLLCQGVPPPPPDVNTTLAADTTGAKSLRQVLEAHLLNPACAACHSLMDPIGFGMENYDAIGAYRTTDNALPIDATGKLPDGTAFNGLPELTQLLAKQPAFASCLSSKLYGYALGRSPVTDDPKQLDPSTLSAITAAFSKGGLKFDGLVRSVVTSPTFLNRRGEGN